MKISATLVPIFMKIQIRLKKAAEAQQVQRLLCTPGGSPNPSVKTPPWHNEHILS